jgi:murein DD-endopeptidase MepM/ murein hydrolase activator NlpD
MPRFQLPKTLPTWVKDFGHFLKFLRRYVKMRGYVWFSRFEVIKDVLVDLLYKQRGRYARPFLHFGTIGLVFAVITFGPLVLSQAQTTQEQQGREIQSIVSQVNTSEQGFNTLLAEEVKQYRGGEIITHSVQEGETLDSVAKKYGLQITTVAWENDLDLKAKLKVGQTLRILPVDGVRHKVARGETIYTIGKKYKLESEAEVQGMINYPFNDFLNAETFELAIGQFIIVPDGIKPTATAVAVNRGVFGTQTPPRGAVTATGRMVWPAQGIVTQGYRFYHRAYDIANRAGGPILAADSGTVVMAGWPDNSGYANRVVIDHGNGITTLYAHLSVIQVRAGQTVNRGDVVGQMGCTGRCTGTHLHFEVRQGSVLLDPGAYLGR